MVVFSPTTEFKGEAKIVAALFREGLTFYHLRRPRWSQKNLVNWLKNIPEEWRGRIVLHQFPEMAGTLGVAGFCAESPSRLPSKSLDCGLRMAVCRGYEDILEVRKQCDAVLLGPVFLNENRDLTVPARTPEEFAATAAYFRKKFPNSPVKLLAYGGINNAASVRAASAFKCFDGFASMSGVWNEGDPVENFRKLCKNWRVFP